MRCPRCGQDADRVIDSRVIREGRAVRRRRECGGCSERFTTYEALETQPVIVIKRGGQRVAYDRAKVISGIAKACEKRPVSLDDIETMADRVEQELVGAGAGEVSTQRIGELVMALLRKVDEVAYVRFASVYRSFRDVNQFMDELRTLLQEKRRDI